MNVRRSWRGKFVMELLVLVQQVRCQVSGLTSESRTSEYTFPQILDLLGTL